MEILIKAAGVCIIGAILGTVLKKDSPSIAVLLAAAVLGTVIYLISGMLSDVSAFLEEISGAANIEPSILYALLKIVLIALITRVASDVCNDAGMKAASTGVEMAGNFTAFFTALPLIKTVYKMISDLL